MINVSVSKAILNQKCWYNNNRCNSQNFEFKHANVHYCVVQLQDVTLWENLNACSIWSVNTGKVMLVADEAVVVIQ